MKSNSEYLKKGLDALGELAKDMVFVGGIVVDYYTDYKKEIRSTLDLDVVVEVGGYVDYHNLEDRLRSIGWLNSTGPKDPPCRFVKNEIILDVMPSVSNELLVSNDWYESGFAARKQHDIGDGSSILIFPFSYFLAAKLTAFNDRGEGNYIEAKDMVDIFNLLGTSNLADEFAKFKPPVKDYIVQEFKKYLKDDNFVFTLNGHFMHTENHIVQNINKVFDLYIGL